MKDPIHHIDDLFYKGLRDHTERPDGAVWDAIKTDLDSDVATTYKRKYKIVKRNALILFVVLLGFIAYEAISLYQKKDENKLQAKTGISHQDFAASDPVEALSAQSKSNIKSRNENESKPAINKHLHDIYAGDIEVTRIKTDLTGSVFSETKSTLPGDIVVRDELFATTSNIPVTTDQPAMNDAGSIKTATAFEGMMENKSWIKKDIVSHEPIVFASPLKPSINASAINIPARANESGFFVSTYFAAALSKSSVTTEEYRRYRRGRRNNTNNNGSNSGNNAPPVNGGNNNGNNGNNNNGGNNGNNGNTGNSGGGRGGRGDRNDIKQGESHNMAWAVGIKLGYNLNKRLSIETGVNYLLTSTTVKPKVVYAEKDDHGKVGFRLNCSSGYSYLVPKQASSPNPGDSTVVSDTRNTVSYIGVPLVMQYKILSSGHFTLKAAAGGQFNFLLKGSTKSVFGKGTAGENTTSSNTEGLKSNYFSALVSLDAELSLNKHLSLSLSPFGQFGLTNVNKRSSVQTRPNYIGASAGLKLKL